MLETIELECWEDFEKIIKPQIEHQLENFGDTTGWSASRDPILFRGQPDSMWGLDTTLDRWLGKNTSLIFYKRLISTILPEIETFTGRKWDTDFDSKANEDLALTFQLPANIVKLLPLEYMTYLRHYGFPSPLLDWSLSPYIAAYFAFRDMSNPAKSVAIYQYNQIFNYEQYYDIHKEFHRPIITPLWINPLWIRNSIKNNKRHYLQQGIYTVCVNANSNDFYFAHHEDVYPLANEPEKSNEYTKMETLTKYILPSSERRNALLHLEMYNINLFSLMGTEESLLETLFSKYISRNMEESFKRSTNIGNGVA